MILDDQARPLIEIDYRRQSLRGCLICNEWRDSTGEPGQAVGRGLDRASCAAEEIGYDPFDCG
jgi:hypothetical protein